MAFDGPDTTHLLYRAFRDWVGVTSPFHTDQPSVEAVALKGDSRGYVVVVNHSPKRQRVALTAAIPIRGLRQITPAGARDLALRGSTCQLEIDPYDGIVAEWR